MQPSDKKKRTEFLINPAFQLRLVVHFFLMLLAVLIVIYWAQDWFFSKMTQNGQTLGLAGNNPYFQMIHDQRRLMDRLFGAFCGLSSGGILLWGVMLSHKIAGPIYRARKYLEQVARNPGQKPAHALSFRDGDFFPELADSINDALGNPRS
jgi:hypothetical protein